MSTVKSLPIALRAFDRHEAIRPLTHYAGILSMHAFARLAVIDQNEALLERIRAVLRPFIQGERIFRCNYTNYHCGGNASAFLLAQGHFPEARDAVRRYAHETMTVAPRAKNGVLCHPREPERERIFIDVAFAVTPFLLFAGLALEEESYVEEAFQQTFKMVTDFLDPENDLLHQCRNFRAPGQLSEDHWSRGNGWGIHALTELVNYLPEDHPRRPEAEDLFTGLLTACLHFQDADGLWHQEMTDPESYVETSGSGLILYALGVALERELLPEENRAELLAGLRGYLSYIAVDGSVHNTCTGCLCPGDGTIEAYKQRGHALNDCHAFGPVTLAFGQAYNLGIKELAI